MTWTYHGAGMYDGRCAHCDQPSTAWQGMPNGGIVGFNCPTGCVVEFDALTIELVGREAIEVQRWIERTIRLDRDLYDHELDLLATLG